jgi:glutathione synthase/RimK-type ligase-like ATP-grasp enzyme
MNHARTIGVLVPTDGTTPTTPPEHRPIGRAALRLAKHGIDVVFGDQLQDGALTGFRATETGWTPAANVPLFGVHDRFPSQLRSEKYAQLLNALNGLPMGNSPEVTLLCRDKLATQRALQELGIPMPAVEADPARFEETLQKWGKGFLKPRFGALGIGVVRVSPGDSLPTHTHGVVPYQPDPTILQEAVPPPSGWASRTVRVLIQRETTGGWFSGIPVVRQSREDPVANAARGAEVAPGPAILDAATLNRIDDSIQQICGAFDRLQATDRMVEAGVDLVLDAEYHPWLIEVNSRPRGRMEVLASLEPETYLDAHIDACARPLQVIASWMEAED